MAFWRLLEAPGGFWLPERPDPAIWTPRASRSSSGGFWRLLEASGGSWRGYWRLLEAPGGSWALLEGFWELLEGLLEVPGGCWSFRRLLEASGGFWRGYWRLLEDPGDSWRLLETPGGSWKLPGWRASRLIHQAPGGRQRNYFSPTYPQQVILRAIYSPSTSSETLVFIHKTEECTHSASAGHMGWVEVLRG